MSQSVTNQVNNHATYSHLWFVFVCFFCVVTCLLDTVVFLQCLLLSLLHSYDSSEFSRHLFGAVSGLRVFLFMFHSLYHLTELPWGTHFIHCRWRTFRSALIIRACSHYHSARCYSHSLLPLFQIENMQWHTLAIACPHKIHCIDPCLWRHLSLQLRGKHYCHGTVKQ